MSFLTQYWKKYKLIFMSSVICVALEAVCDLILPQIMAKLIDNGVSRLDLKYVLTSGLMMLLVTALGTVFACARNVLSSKTSQSFGADLRKDVFVKILNLPVSQSDQFDAGSLVTRLTNDVTQLTNFINGLMRIIFKAPITCIGCIILAVTINVRTTPIVLGIVCAAIVSFAFSMKLSYPAFAKVQKGIDGLNTSIREYLMGIRLVKAFGRFQFEEERFQDANENLSRTSKKANRIMAVFSPITNLAANMGVVCILILGYHLVKSGDMKVGQIVAFVTYMSQILISLSMISNILNIFVRTKASYIRIAEVMNINETENSNAKTSADKLVLGNRLVEFQNVSFRYPMSTGESALQSLCFSIQRGETLGIIGPTGSGKSTIATLLLGFYEITEGQVRVGNEDLKDISTHLLRKHVKYVPQTPTLFSGSIKENLLWGKDDAADEEVIHAAKTAQAYEFIAASQNGFDTMLGQGGINLSGGQKQRISIARALVGNPDVLILDDCTSALDSITEAKVQQSLKTAAENLTCILISQRISSVMKSDKILVLDHGQQAGLGTHQELIASCRVYQDIFHSQIGEGVAYGK